MRRTPPGAFSGARRSDTLTGGLVPSPNPQPFVMVVRVR